MVRKRTPKTVVIKEDQPTDQEIEVFGDQADQADQPVPPKLQRLDPHEKPLIGINVKFNHYEHALLKRVAREEGRSLQKQIKFTLLKGLQGKYGEEGE